MASMLNRSMSAVGDLGLMKPTDLPGNLMDESEEMRKKRLAMMKEQPMGIISPAVQALLGGGRFNGV